MPDQTAEPPATLTIQQAADLLGVNPHTLRYYERAGLLTSVPRSARTHRIYTEREIGALRFLILLRTTGMSIQQIKVYVELLSQGPGTLQQREALLADHEQQVLAQISALQQGLPTIQRKLDLYRQKHREQFAPTGEQGVIMQQRQLGSLQVSAIGLGCMGMSAFYGPRDDDTSLRAMERAVELGVTFFDTAEAYGNGANEALIGRFLKQSAQRDRVVVATKFANARPSGEKLVGSDPAVYIRQACEASLKHLGVERLDLFYQHRVDRQVPVEDTVGVMAELVQEGKVAALGLSEVSPETLRRAHAVHPISAVQTEYSLWTRDPEVNGVLETCRELGVGFVPYSPLGRGFLVGQFKSPDDLAPDDGRRNHPRFQGENFRKNLNLAETVKRLAEEKGCTPAQLALAWILAQGQDLVPIPGSRHARNIEDNARATEVQITAAELRMIDQVFPLDAAQGTRYPDMTSVNQ